MLYIFDTHTLGVTSSCMHRDVAQRSLVQASLVTRDSLTTVIRMTEVMPRMENGESGGTYLGYCLSPFLLLISLSISRQTMSTSVVIKESKQILNVGVVGCGEVAQIVHVRQDQERSSQLFPFWYNGLIDNLASEYHAFSSYVLFESDL